MFNRDSLNVSFMNYGDVAEVAKTIEVNGDLIYNSLNNIRSEFMKMQEAGFAGSTLSALIQALDRVRNIPEDVQSICQQFATFANQAVAEVREAEAANANTLDQIISMDPMSFEVPEWSVSVE